MWPWAELKAFLAKAGHRYASEHRFVYESFLALGIPTRTVGCQHCHRLPTVRVPTTFPSLPTSYALSGDGNLGWAIEGKVAWMVGDGALGIRDTVSSWTAASYGGVYEGTLLTCPAVRSSWSRPINGLILCILVFVNLFNKKEKPRTDDDTVCRVARPG